MRTSGLVLDFYDDCKAETFRSMYPTADAVPPLMKTAHVLSVEERQSLPDDAYALVLVGDEGSVLRKYACIDAGNTALAVGYFMQSGHKLPVEAQKTAAANLCTACDWYDLTPPEELTKVALLGLVMTGANVAMAAPAMGAAMKQGAGQVRQAQGVVTPGISKQADVTGTTLMPYAQTTSKGISKAVIRKTAAMHPYVDVRGAEPPVVVERTKQAHYSALPGRYPLDTLEQVKTAAAYFDDYSMHFDPAVRREYCVNLVKRAHALQIPVSDLVEHYGSSRYGTEEEVKIAMEARKTLVFDPKLHAAFDKLAAIRPTMNPDAFAMTLEELDKLAGVTRYYDSDIPDAYYSTFGIAKQASFSEVIGADYTNEAMLQQAAVAKKYVIAERFSDELAEEFQKDPVGIFKSLPSEQKQILMRIAAQ